MLGHRTRDDELAGGAAHAAARAGLMAHAVGHAEHGDHAPGGEGDARRQLGEPAPQPLGSAGGEAAALLEAHAAGQHQLGLVVAGIDPEREPPRPRAAPDPKLDLRVPEDEPVRTHAAAGSTKPAPSSAPSSAAAWSGPSGVRGGRMLSHSERSRDWARIRLSAAIIG